MKEKSAVRIMLLLLNLMCIFQASNANLLNELLVYFCWQQLYNEVHQIDDVTNKSCKNDKNICVASNPISNQLVVKHTMHVQILKEKNTLL